MNPKILILSSIYDFSTDLVVLKLKEMGVPVLRLNKEYLKDYKITLNPLEPLLLVSGPDFNSEITSDIVSVFYRQPVFLRNTPPHPLNIQEQLERSQWMAFLRALSIFDSACWMNFPRETYLAESKPYQLSIAKKVGFNIPKTLVSNDSDYIKTIFNDNIIIKSLDTVLLREGNDCLFTYTTIDNIAILTDENVRATPFLIQEHLFDKIDIRVTIIGDKIFPIKILSNNKGIEGDWRITPKNKLEYVDFKLDVNLEIACRNLMKSLTLNFGAIDLIEANNSTYFIEINPTGEWGWIDDSNRQFDSTIAEWLSNPTG